MNEDQSFSTEYDARHSIVLMMRSLSPLGLNQGKSGNASLRWHRGAEPGMLLTPSGIAYDRMEPDDLVWVPFAQPTAAHDPGSARAILPGAAASPEVGLLAPPARFDGRLAPSSEWRIHLDLQSARPDARAILHLHSPNATALACTDRVQRSGIPAFHYMVAVAGGKDLRCAPYATFGSVELSQLTLAALAGRRACLMANHGMIALAPSLRQVLDLAIEVEQLCRMYAQVLQLGEPVLLDDQEMDRVLARFAVYGRDRPAASTAAK
jgi:L-fuculose-phosphate aldolase